MSRLRDLLAVGLTLLVVALPRAHASALAIVITSHTDALCNGGSSGTAHATASGGSLPYSYSWSPSGGTGSSASGLAAGDYTVTVIDVTSATATASVTIAEPSAIVTSAGTVTQPSCHGGTNGAATVIASGGTGALNYAWSPGGSMAATATGLGANTYTVTVTDDSACTKTQLITVAEPTAIAVSPSQTDVSCFGGANGTATAVTVGGTAGYTYSWLPSGGSAATASGLAAGSYTNTITDANGCTATQSYTIMQPTAAVGGAIIPTNVTCFGSNNGTAMVSPSGGNGGYVYDWNGTPTGDGSATITGLAAGDYSVTITDSKSCTGTVSTTITAPTQLTTTAGLVTNEPCSGDNKGGASVTASGGTPSYSYAWAPSGGTGPSASSLAAGMYTVTVTDANSCTTTRNYNITQPSALIAASAGSNNVSCNGGTNGTASVKATGGTGTFSYDWLPSAPTGDGTANVTGLAAGSYTANVTDINGCMSSQTYSITQPSAIVVSSAGQTNLTCNGVKTGAASVNASGGTGTLTYDWSPGTPTGDGTASVSALGAGVYSATVTDGNSCTATQTFNVTQPTKLTATAVAQKNPTCFASENGTATVGASGGTGTLTYAWAPGSPTGNGTTDVTGLGAGVYTATVTDVNMCTTTQTFSLTQPVALTATISSHQDISCNGASDGSATVTAGGGTGVLTYDWTGTPTGDATPTASGLPAGTQRVTVTDSNSCTTQQSIQLTEPGVLLANGTSTGVSAVGNCDGSAAVAPSGGTGPYTIAWSPGGQSSTAITAQCAATDIAVVTDAHSCTASFTATLSAPSADLSIVITGPTSSVNAGAAATYTITAATSNDAPTATVNGSVPTSTTFVSLVAPSGWTCTTPAVGANGAWSCSATTLSASLGATFTLTANVTELFGHGTITVAAEVAAAVNDATSSNNHASVDTTIVSPGLLAARKTVAFTSPDVLTYTIVVTNTGAAAALDSIGSDELTDALPSSLQLTSAASDVGTTLANGNGFSWNGTLLKNASATITVVTKVITPPAAGTPIANQAMVNYDANGDGTDDTTEGSSPDDTGIAPTLFTLPIVDMSPPDDLAVVAPDDLTSVVGDDMTNVPDLATPRDLIGADMTFVARDMAPATKLGVSGGGVGCHTTGDLDGTSAFALLAIACALLLARRRRYSM